jgi:hypothetical protein
MIMIYLHLMQGRNLTGAKYVFCYVALQSRRNREIEYTDIYLRRLQQY